MIPVADDVPINVRDDDAAAFADVAVPRRPDNLVVDVPLETLRVVRDLNKTAACEADAGVLPKQARVVGGGLVALHMLSLRSVEKSEKFGGLPSGTHIVM